MFPIPTAWLRPLLVITLATIGLLATSAAQWTPVDSSIVAQAGTPPPVPQQRQGPFAVVIVVDAARADEFDLTKMPNLAYLVAHGASFPRAWVGLLPSVTESSHATIGTGVFPKRHSILGDTWRVPGTSEMSPNLLDGTLTRTGYIGKLIRQSKVPSMASILHARYPGSVVVALSGHKIYAADALGAGASDYVAFGTKNQHGHFVPGAIPGNDPALSIMQSPQLDLPTYPRVPGLEDDWTTTLALKFLFKYHPRLLMVNLPEVDTLGHANGTDGTVIGPLMSNVDKQIGRVVAAYGRAGMLSQTTFVITADHGMVPGLHTVLHADINRIVTAAGGQPMSIGHGDDSSIWLKNLDSVPRVAAALSGANIPNVAAVFARDPHGHYALVSPLARLATPVVKAAFGDLLASFDQAEAPDIVLLYDENTFTETPLYLQINRKGDHGGASWGAQHIPLVISGPGIKAGYVSPFPARLIDIAPTVETLLGARPSHQDGVPLADAMVNPPASALKSQSKRVAKMTTDVNALETEANLRPNGIAR